MQPTLAYLRSIIRAYAKRITNVVKRDFKNAYTTNKTAQELSYDLFMLYYNTGRILLLLSHKFLYIHCT